MTGNTVQTPKLADMDPRLHRFLDVWRAARGDATVPLRKAFDPTSVPSLLSNIYIYRFHEDAGDYVCELAGEHVNDAYGRAIRGETLLQIVGARDHPVITERWERILGVPCVHYGTANEILSNARLTQAERLLLPFASAADQPADTIIGVGLYSSRRRWPDQPPLLPSDIVQIPCSEI
ncbi:MULTISPECIES: PAS domain-containing protein [unclassified Minwuia]|jgi:hypothetical protein|uniref:PAS domain-containing protein n=1 Tax=unclassified Minwuia TaxID=2618799 RepID=UPI00247A39AF|nr:MULTISPECIES: PAS domain-containing protein [unclassified Minwuia]